MKLAFFVVASALLVLSVAAIGDAVDKDLIMAVNSNPKSTWRAGLNEYFYGRDLSWAKRLMGVVDTGRTTELPLKVHSDEAVAALPSSFDSASSWPQCASIRNVRDQANCGSCWAVSTASAITDRTCIHSSNATNPYISAEDILTCCPMWECGFGCNGGQPPAAWNYWVQTGVVDGGAYGDTRACDPYALAPCAHHVPGNGTIKPCPPEVPTPSCKKACVNGQSWSASKHFGKTSYMVGSQQEQIMAEIQHNGPVGVAFTVYSDFLNYKSGVYQHTSGSALGGHAVVVVGWGEENGTPYWRVRNSWNNLWGDNGFFKILRGSNECGIESEVVAGLPK